MAACVSGLERWRRTVRSCMVSYMTNAENSYEDLLRSMGAESAEDHTECRVNMSGTHRGNLYCVSHAVRLIASNVEGK